jgi:molybdopterin-guanine dinucleotide biosynthesis adapter protein
VNVLGICGDSDSGKTTLIERLVPAFEPWGRVGTIKSIHHEIELDTPGTDTHRHATAGADSVVGITPSQTFEISARGKKREDVGERAGELDALSEQLRSFRRRGYDVVLVEGFRRAPVPKIVVGKHIPENTAPAVVAYVVRPTDFDVDAFATAFDAEATTICDYERDKSRLPVSGRSLDERDLLTGDERTATSRRE